MSNNDRDKWNRKYQSSEPDNNIPAFVLSENLHLLPPTGKALDLACGLGANAIQLANCGLDVCAWDISDIALGQLSQKAAETGLRIEIQQRDICINPPLPETFDVIVVAHFLDRSLIPHIITSLRNNGLVFYQTFTRDKLDDIGPSNPDYLLAHNELLELFKKLSIVLYREEARTGTPGKGHRNEAMLIAQKLLSYG